MDEALTDHTIKIALLQVFASYASGNRPAHKINVIGRSFQQGDLERSLGRKLSNAERARAGICVQELVKQELLEPTYSDLQEPESWLTTTPRGLQALSHGALDELDEALSLLEPSFVQLRHGAWSAATSSAPDNLRHAAHSARELIRQVLDKIAPIGEVKTQDWFRPDSSSTHGVNRKMRVRLAIQKRSGRRSESDLKVVESAMALINHLYDKLSAEAHAGSGSLHIVDCLKLTEAALSILLLSERPASI